jgi:hypothetical protein
MSLASRVGLPPTVLFAATKWTTQIAPMGVPRMGQKANAAVTTEDSTACQIGLTAQDRIQRSLILTNNRKSAIVLMPVRAKCKEFPGSYDKNARFSVRVLSVFDTPSSYELDANASRARARFFCGLRQIESQPAGATA